MKILLQESEDRTSVNECDESESMAEVDGARMEKGWHEVQERKKSGPS